MKYFWLIRHAKTLQATASAHDFERKLSASGHVDGRRMAQYFADQVAADSSQCPEWLVTSAAKRAQETGQYVAEGFGITVDQIVVTQALYLADPQTLLAVLRETPADINSVALVAHNPGLSWLVNRLAGGSQDIALPTLGCACFCSTVTDWAQLNQAEMVSFMTPRLLPMP